MTLNDVLFLAELLGSILKRIINTVDKYGLKRRNLNKHKRDVQVFYQTLEKFDIVSDEALKLKKRLLKNRQKLFAFLNFDGVPWNNHNAEHAIKAFTKNRKQADGNYNETGLKEYLLLLSVSQTCHYRNISFFDYLTGKRLISFE